MKKQKCLNFGPKMPFCGIFDQKCFVLVFFARILKKTNVIFEFSTLEFIKLQNFVIKQKCLNLEPKMPALGIFD